MVPTSPIDPNNDLRSATVLPTSTPQIDNARAGLIDATTRLGNYDRLASINDLMARFGVPNVDVPQGPGVGAGPSEQGTLDTLGGQVSGAANRVAGYDRTADVSGLRDRLTRYFGGTDVQAGPDIATSGSDRLNRLGSMVDSSASRLAGVDRVALAKDLLDQFDTQQLPEHELALRKLTEEYAARGGGRSGMLRTAYGNEDLQRLRDRDQMKRALISAAIEGSIGDEFNKTHTLSGLEAGLASREAGIRGEQRADRGYQTDVATGNVARRLATRQAAQNAAANEADANYATRLGTLGALSGVQGATAAREAARRGELRTERDTATALAERNAARRLGALESTRGFAAHVADTSAADAARRTAAQQNLFDTLTSEGAVHRAETRGERAHQVALEGQSYNRALTQQELEQQQRQAETARQLALLGAGESGNPADTVQRVSAGTGLDANLIAQLAASLGRNSAATPAKIIPGANLPLPSGFTLPDFGGIFA